MNTWLYIHNKGRGRVCITRDKKIENYTDVEGLDKTISDHNGLDCTVTDFKLLREY